MSITIADYKNKDHAMRRLKEAYKKIDVVLKELARDDTELIFDDYDDYTIVQAIENYEHAYIFSFATGAWVYRYIVLCSDSYELDALEELADMLRGTERDGRLLELDRIEKENINDDTLQEEYYPVNGGEYYIELPCNIVKLY